MTKEEIAEILAKPYAEQLLNGPEPARMAYNGLDGDPRVIPIGFWTEGARVVMATVPKSAKVAALQSNPKVALTIDQGAFPPKVLLIRGTAEVKLIEGIPDGYLTAGRKVMTDAMRRAQSAAAGHTIHATADRPTMATASVRDGHSDLSYRESGPRAFHARRTCRRDSVSVVAISVTT